MTLAQLAITVALLGGLGPVASRFGLSAIPAGASAQPRNRTLSECGFRKRTDVTVIAILRDPEPIGGAQPGDVIQEGDTLVVVGTAGQFANFRKVLAEGPVGVES